MALWAMQRHSQEWAEWAEAVVKLTRLIYGRKGARLMAWPGGKALWAMQCHSGEWAEWAEAVRKLTKHFAGHMGARWTL